MSNRPEASTAAQRPCLRLSRILDAKREHVWAAWTKPEMMIAWLGPEDWPAVSVTADLKVGGRWSATLQSPTGGQALRQGGVYREIVPPERIAFTFKWEGNHEDGEPVETLVTVTLAELSDGRTRMDFIHEGLKSEQSLAGHRHGWTSTFERLDAWIGARTVRGERR